MVWVWLLKIFLLEFVNCFDSVVIFNWIECDVVVCLVELEVQWFNWCLEKYCCCLEVILEVLVKIVCVGFDWQFGVCVLCCSVCYYFEVLLVEYLFDYYQLGDGNCMIYLVSLEYEWVCFVWC